MTASFFDRKMKHGNLKSKKANIESFSTFDVGFFGDSQYEFL